MHPHSNSSHASALKHVWALSGPPQTRTDMLHFNPQHQQHLSSVPRIMASVEVGRVRPVAELYSCAAVDTWHIPAAQRISCYLLRTALRVITSFDMPTRLTLPRKFPPIAALAQILTCIKIGDTKQTLLQNFKCPFYIGRSHPVKEAVNTLALLLTTMAFSECQWRFSYSRHVAAFQKCKASIAQNLLPAKDVVTVTTSHALKNPHVSPLHVPAL